MATSKRPRPPGIHAHRHGGPPRRDQRRPARRAASVLWGGDGDVHLAESPWRQTPGTTTGGEAIAKDQGGGPPFVTEAHAIQAGREVRVIVDAKKAGDVDAFAIAQNIAKKVEAEITFPGEIKVTVLREVRVEATAR